MDVFKKLEKIEDWKRELVLCIFLGTPQELTNKKAINRFYKLLCTNVKENRKKGIKIIWSNKVLEFLKKNNFEKP